jgi:enoyl-CoA hydratase/carnithine racemase
MVNKLALSSKPIVAAVHGYALGGGFETALACDYRCALLTARFGLPEVNIGAVPGYGGTQRLPRLMGLEGALQLMLSGEPMDARQAQQHGVLDSVVSDDLLAAATAFAGEIVASGARLRKTDSGVVTDAIRAGEICAAALEQAGKDRPGEDAPSLIVKAARVSVDMKIADGLQYERELARSRLTAPQCLAMRYLFFAERAARKKPALRRYFPSRDENPANFSAAVTTASKQRHSEYGLGNRLILALLEARRSLLAQGVDRIAIEQGLADFGWPLNLFAADGGAGANLTPAELPATDRPNSFDGKALRSAEIVQHCLEAVVRAGESLMAEDIALQPGDIDAICCNAYAFPRYRGGPMYIATLEQNIG